MQIGDSLAMFVARPLPMILSKRQHPMLMHRASRSHGLLFLEAACPRNVRVGLNSPSLCPTMSSVTYTA